MLVESKHEQVLDPSSTQSVSMPSTESAPKTTSNIA